MDLGDIILGKQARSRMVRGHDAPQAVISATVIANVSAPGDPIRCKDVSTRLEFTATSWTVNGGSLPAAGDACHVIQSSSGEYVCLSYGIGTVTAGVSGYSVSTVNTNTTIDTGDRLVLVTGAVTITLPPTPSTGQAHTIKDASGIAAATPITISGNGAYIDGAASIQLTTNYQAIECVWGGSAWAAI